MKYYNSMKEYYEQEENEIQNQLHKQRVKNKIEEFSMKHQKIGLNKNGDRDKISTQASGFSNFSSSKRHSLLTTPLFNREQCTQR